MSISCAGFRFQKKFQWVITITLFVYILIVPLVKIM